MLKTLFASKGFSPKALEGLADVISVNLTEESTDAEITAAIEAVKPMTDIMQSEINRQVNANKPKPEDKPAEKPAEETKPANDADVPEWAKSLVKSVETLGQGLQALQTEKIGNTRREQFIKSMEGTSKEYQARELKKFDLFTFRDDAHFNEVLESMKEDHAAAIQEETNETLGGGRPAGGSGSAASKGKASDAEVEAVVDAIL